MVVPYAYCSNVIISKTKKRHKQKKKHTWRLEKHLEPPHCCCCCCCHGCCCRRCCHVVVVIVDVVVVDVLSLSNYVTFCYFLCFIFFISRRSM